LEGRRKGSCAGVSEVKRREKVVWSVKWSPESPCFVVVDQE
jgi:hypothetical protein